MLTRRELLNLARARIKDARALFDSKRYDGSYYLCGYVLEHALKARIVSTLKWDGFPSTAKEFEKFKSFKTHDLGTLLSMTGREKKLRAIYMTEWSTVTEWDPETRYRPVGSADRRDAARMIDSVERLLTAL
jgi:HEPN domain-containing protein